MYNFTDKSIDINNVNIDLRHEFDSLNKEFGINVLYVRNCNFVRCTCFDDLNKTGNPKCPLCMGSGYFSSIQKVKAVKSSNSAYSSDNSITKTSIGAINQTNEIYYFRYDHAPKERDYILKVTWNKHGIPVDIVKVLEIINMHDVRVDNGRAELYGCVVNERPDMVTVFKKILSKLPKKALMLLSNGGCSIWPNILLKSS